MKNTHLIAQRTTARPVNPAATKSILPAFGMSIIASLAYPLSSCEDADRLLPLGLGALTMAFVSSITFKLMQSQTGSQPADAMELDDLNNKDLPDLKSVYVAVSTVSAAVHMVVITLPLLCGSRTAIETARCLGSSTDLVVLGKSICLWTLYTVLDMRRMGYVTTKEAVKAGLLSILSLLVFGPMATYSAVSSWRDMSIARLCVE